MSDRKSSVDEIRARFDADVDRFSNLETGQTATIDAPLAMQLVCEAARRTTPRARSVLDIGCGAGNYTLKLAEKLGPIDVTLVDLSGPMLTRARERLAAAGAGRVAVHQGDIRDFVFEPGRYDVVLAAAVLHHLRTDAEWEAVFRSIYESLRSGGSFWIADLVTHEGQAVQDLMWEGYGEYLVSLAGEPYRDKVFAYIEAEDTPRSLTWQMRLLEKVGFADVDVLHKRSCFAAFGAVKA